MFQGSLHYTEITVLSKELPLLMEVPYMSAAHTTATSHVSPLSPGNEVCMPKEPIFQKFI